MDISIAVNGDMDKNIDEEIRILECDIADKQNRLDYLLNARTSKNSIETSHILNKSWNDKDDKHFAYHKDKYGSKLGREEIARYSRQLILPEIGVNGQLKLQESSVLLIGAGGLGCPAACYLASAGVGRLGIVDYDIVEVNNLHRQVMHTEARIGCSKSISLAASVKTLNPLVKCDCYQQKLTSADALEIVSQYDVVLDCTDNLPSRYLINDACVISGKPLLSGSALRMEGMLVLYNHAGGPCYRCLFPTPPPPHTVTNCAEGGVLGTVPGIIGILQAMEAIKLITGSPVRYHQYMLLYDGMEGRFRDIKLRAKSINCKICGDSSDIKKLVEKDVYDYVKFCGGAALDDKSAQVRLLPPEDRITCQEYKQKVLDEGVNHLLLDVRPTVEYEICSLENSKNIPLSELDSRKNEIEETVGSGCEEIYLLCHHGNDSQIAVEQLRTLLMVKEREDNLIIKDISGGLHRWATIIDHNFPIY